MFKSSTHLKTRLRPTALAIHLALGSLALSAVSLPASAQAQAPQNYNIPAGTLGSAISAFAAQAGVLLSFPPALAAGKNTNGLNGSYSIESGFRSLLQGSGLQALRQPDGSYQLKAGSGNQADRGAETTLGTVVVQASADASAAGLMNNFAGNQVARGGRVGLLGNLDMMETPFSTTAYTSQLIQDQQARSVADVVQNDPTVRVARGFGNFQELYMMRGFPVPSDDMTYNGLYGVLPRQYVAAEFLERVEILRGASSFLNGGVGVASGFGVGGTVNALPKRAPTDPLSQVTLGIDNGGQTVVAADMARRFGQDDRLGIRVNAVRRAGESSVQGEDRDLSVFSLGADYRGERFRISADLGYQDHHIDRPRPSVTPNGTSIPSAPDASRNYGQPWTFTDDQQLFGTLRGEFDLTENLTAWAAGGLRQGKERNALTNLSADGNGKTSAYRFDNAREDSVATGEVGLRGKFATGPVKHTVVLSAAAFKSESKNAYAFGDYFNPYNGNLYSPTSIAMPTPTFLLGGNMNSPGITERTETHSIALADMLAFADGRILLTIGARQQNVKQKNFDNNTGIQTSAYDADKLTPMAGLVFRLMPQVSLYGNYVEGLTKGDSAPWGTVNYGQSLAPHVSKQQEIGAKYDGGKLGASIALFSVDKPFGAVDNNVFKETGTQRNRGLELSAFGEPVHGVRILGGATLLDGKITETTNASLDGKRAIGVPRSQFNLGSEWDIPGLKGLAINTRAVHTAGQYADAANTLRVPSWTRFDLGARYTTLLAEQAVTFRARVDNVTDRNYWASVGGYPGYGYLVLGAPRTFTLSAAIDF